MEPGSGNLKTRTILGILLSLILPMLTTSSHSQGVRKIEIVAKRYQFTPNEITLRKGEPVVLVLRSEDVKHSLSVKDLNLAADITNGRSTELNVTPQKSGDFVGKCGHFCGSGHGRMQLIIHVTG
jgi:cytochrome c oxidase subunit 2